eukprot:CAMPEP_0113942016 /NCGR_PEP_ID=MMETSP1339-20121228/7807_1 /TAXON_ID=94617 /ORGANISM="Fibrocapsa japonica" /LENGTH=485 /DNA_ID=CAMNT_0000946323 /DNA_START=254 /DNA_END=1711 /DNA_ORIENTATION=+ /assembly_acc=CAM_ASM_000762
MRTVGHGKVTDNLFPSQREYEPGTIFAATNSTDLLSIPEEPTSSLVESLNIPEDLIQSPLMRPERACTEEDNDKSGEPEGEVNIWIPRLMMLGATAMYGTNFGSIKLLEGQVSPPVLLLARFGLAFGATLGPLLAFGPAPPLGAVLGAIEVGIYTTIGYVAQLVGLETVGACKAAFICSLAVLAVPYYDSLAGKKQPAAFWNSAILAVLGVGALEIGFPGGDGSPWIPDFLQVAWASGSGEAVRAALEAQAAISSGEALLALQTAGRATFSSLGDFAHLTGAVVQALQDHPGYLLILLQPVFFGLGFWRTEEHNRNYPGHAGTITAGQLGVTAVFGALWAAHQGFFTGHEAVASMWSSVTQSPAVIGGLLWTGLATTALTVYLETYSLQYLSAAEATLIFTLEPLWGAAFAAITLGEEIGVNTAVGAALILSGCIQSATIQPDPAEADADIEVHSVETEDPCATIAQKNIIEDVHRIVEEVQRSR